MSKQSAGNYSIWKNKYKIQKYKIYKNVKYNLSVSVFQKIEFEHV